MTEPMTESKDLRKELALLRQKGDETRMGNRRELLQLRAELASTKKAFEAQVASSAISLYQKAIQDVFRNEDGSGIPQPYVLKVQAQLCHSLHANEVQLKQSKVVKRQHKHITKFFEKEREKLRSESCKSKRDLSDKVYAATAGWQQELGELKTKNLSQQQEIKRLRTMLKLKNESSEDSLDEFELLNGAPSSPKGLSHSLQQSFMRVMEGIHYKDVKHAVMPPSLDRTVTPPNLSNSALWKDLKNSSSSSSLERSRSVGTPGQYSKSLLWNDLKKDHFKKPFTGMSGIKPLKPAKRAQSVDFNPPPSSEQQWTKLKNSNHNNHKKFGGMAGMKPLSGLQRSQSLGSSGSEHSITMNKSDIKPAQKGSMIASIRNLMTASIRKEDLDFSDDIEDDDMSVENPGIDDQYFESPTGSKQKASVLMALVNSDDAVLTPTSKTLKALSAEVFGL
ncbi:MAG: hypothetical protein SGILL_006375 [Bacillariaceae sp.]